MVKQIVIILLVAVALLGAMLIPHGKSKVRKQQYNCMSKFVAQKNAKKSKYSTNDNPHYKPFRTVF